MYRLIGIGKCTKGVKHELTPGEPVILGRHPTATVALTRTPSGSGDFEYLSRQHAVLEDDPQRGWSIRDNGSLNGTAVLRSGLPPAVRLPAGDYLPLQDGDVIELADCDDFQLAFQSISQPERPQDSRVGSETDRLLSASHACVQLIHRGAATAVFELRGSTLSIGGGPAPSALPWLAIPGIEIGRLVATLTPERHGATLRVRNGPLRLNLDDILPEAPASLRDGDLLTFPGAQETSLLFLDPRQTPPRNLSDLMGDSNRISIGSGSDQSCRLLHPSLSRAHAEVWRQDGSLFIRDLQSTNGTTIDGRRIFDTERLQPKATIGIGRLPFVADEGCWRAGNRKPAAVDVRFAGVSVSIAGKLRLNDVSFGIGHGEMVGVLGPSASGKSTLLKLLAGHYRLAAGEMWVNGKPLSRNQERWDWLASLVGFRDENYEVGLVQQQDLVQPGLKVREILEFAGRQMGLSSAEASRKALDAAGRCNLEPLFERVVQWPNGQLNLSGGQLKRVCVAIEVLRQSKVLVLDEPTTGQDPKNTDDLMHLFRSLSQQGVTLLVSTHDLRNLVLFDKIAVLCLGRLVYYGSPTSFPAQFSAASAEDVYRLLPDKESGQNDADALARRFRASSLYRTCYEASE